MCKCTSILRKCRVGVYNVMKVIYKYARSLSSILHSQIVFGLDPRPYTQWAVWRLLSMATESLNRRDWVSLCLIHSPFYLKRLLPRATILLLDTGTHSMQWCFLFFPVSTLSRRFSCPCFGLAEQRWQADSFAFRRIKATFPPWQPVLFCHLIAWASHFSGQPLLLDRPLSLPIILSVYPALTPPTPPQHAAPLSSQCNYFFLTSHPSALTLKALSADIHC